MTALLPPSSIHLLAWQHTLTLMSSRSAVWHCTTTMCLQNMMVRTGQDGLHMLCALLLTHELRCALQDTSNDMLRVLLTGACVVC